MPVISILDSLNTFTVAIMWIWLLFAFFIVMAYTYYTRKTYAGFVYWTVSHFCIFLSIVLMFILRGKIHDFFVIFLGNFLVFMHAALMYAGLSRFYDLPHKKLNDIINYTLAILGSSTLYYFTGDNDDINIRTIIFSFVCFILFGRVAVEPLFSKIARKYKTQYIITGCIAPVAIIFLIRIFNFLIGYSASSFSNLINTDYLLKTIILIAVFDNFILVYCYFSLTSDRLESELRESQIKEFEVLMNQRRMFSMIAHELKTPLSVITRSAQMIEHKLKNFDYDAVFERLITIKNKARNLMFLIELIQNNALIISEAFKSNLLKMNISSYVEEIVYEHRIIYPDRKIVLMDTTTKNNFVHIDKELFQIVFNNLLNNAVKFSSADDDIDIKIYSEHDYICIAITDKGIGIPQDEVKSIGKLFFRASNSTAYSGSGVGLNTVKQIVELHNGKLDIKSTQGMGTIVIISLPKS